MRGSGVAEMRRDRMKSVPEPHEEGRTLHEGNNDGRPADTGVMRCGGGANAWAWDPQREVRQYQRLGSFDQQGVRLSAKPLRTHCPGLGTTTGGFLQ